MPHSDLHEEDNVMNQMRKKLPQYICNCFEEAGYETADAICEMNDESVTDMEKYIDERKDNLLHCMRRNKCTSEPFRFPPGHRILIKKFISSFKGKQLPLQATSGPPAKKRKVSSSLVCGETTSSPSQSQAQQLPETAQTVTNDIRCKVQKWVKDYNKGELDTMIEGDDYSIAVSEPKTNTSICEASILCKCGKSYAVNIGPKGHRMINNWSKHVKKCLRMPKDQSKPAKEITQFFSRPHSALTGNTTLSSNGATAKEATSQSLSHFFPITQSSYTSDVSPPSLPSTSQSFFPITQSSHTSDVSPPLLPSTSRSITQSSHYSDFSPPSLPLEVVSTEITTEGYHPAEYMDEHNLQDQSLIDNIQVPPLNPIPISPLSPSPPSLLELPCQLSSEQSLESKQEKPSTNQVF